MLTLLPRRFTVAPETAKTAVLLVPLVFKTRLLAVIEEAAPVAYKP